MDTQMMHAQRAKGRAEEVGKMYDLAASEGRALTAEEDERVIEMLREVRADLDAASRIAEAKAVVDAMSASAQPDIRQMGAGTEEQREPSMREFRREFADFVMRGRAGGRLEWALSVGTDSAGGYTVPEEWRAMLEAKEKAFGGVSRMGVTRLSTPTSVDLHIPQVDNTGNQLDMKTETQSAGEKNATYAESKIGAQRVTGETTISNKLMRDSIFDISGISMDQLAEMRARRLASQYLSGNGTAPQLKGLNQYSSYQAVALATADTYARGDLIGMIKAIDAAYYSDPSAAFLVAPWLYWKMVEAEAATTIYNSWLFSIRDGEPATFLGKRIEQDYGLAAATETNANITASTILGYFGPWSKVILRDVTGMTMIVDPYTLAGEDQTLLVVSSYHDILVLRDTAFSQLKGK